MTLRELEYDLRYEGRRAGDFALQRDAIDQISRRHDRYAERPRRRVGTEIFDVIHDNVATKGDVAAVKTDLQQLEQRMLLRMAGLEHRLVTRLGGLVVVVTGLLFAALPYWPPHG